VGGDLGCHDPYYARGWVLLNLIRQPIYSPLALEYPWAWMPTRPRAYPSR
jgi:hypothetical protein